MKHFVLLLLTLAGNGFAMGPIDDAPTPIRVAENDVDQWLQQPEQQKQKRRMQQKVQQPPPGQRAPGQRRPGPRRPASMSSSTTVASNRMNNRFGFYLGVLEPYGALVSGNVAYNITDFLRASVGAGYIAALDLSLFTIGGGLTAFVPNWSFTPVAGIGASYASLSGTTSSSNTDVLGFTGSGGKVYGIVGADWQARGGFNVSFGVSIATHAVFDSKGKETGSSIGLLPYVGLGWFFNWLNG